MPKHIKVDGIDYILDELEIFYYRDNNSKEDLLVLGKDYSTWDFLNWNVEVIEAQTIDIDSIKEFNVDLDFNDLDKFEDGLQIGAKINQLIQAVKQLNREIKELKEKGKNI